MEDYSQYNIIDTECNFVDDDDDSFGNIVVKVTKPDEISDFAAESEDRTYNKTTGVIINMNDGDSELNINIKPKKQVEKSISDDIEVMELPAIKVNDLSDLGKINNYSGFNEIDTECEIGDDEDDDFGGPVASSLIKKLYDFDDEEVENAFLKKELVDEEVIEEAKKKKTSITDGQVEDDYWDELSKKHKSSNKKGAYNASFRIVGDPKAEMDFFNHAMGNADGSSGIISIEGNGTSGNITGAASSCEGCIDGGGMSESLKTHYSQLYEDLLYLTGFEVEPQEDGKFLLRDTLSGLDDKICCDRNEIISCLDPYINDCIIIPLQVKTGQKLNTCKDWCDWYTINKEAFPQCQNDIDYCDLICNHINEF